MNNEGEKRAIFRKEKEDLEKRGPSAKSSRLTTLR